MNATKRCKAVTTDRMITLTLRQSVLDKDHPKRSFDALHRRLLRDTKRGG